ncbi:hypothetical protein FOPE_10334 [Fonsecaea pedrosoi]|nr:hypothetical protein FOPE_10334 [Fonsecaea pedrosoi]
MSREPRQYRPAKELPFELAQQVQTYFEEGLFTQAFSFLLSIIGNSASPLARLAPAIIPPPAQIALAATLAVHPTTTSGTNSREKWNQANAALRLLRLIQNLVGPVNADFNTAFSFRKFDSRVNRRSDHPFDDDEHDAGGGEGDRAAGASDLNTPYARSQSLWARAEDFWELVGWAFNCACHPGIYMTRWNHYQLLLGFLIDVLEEDWYIRSTSGDTTVDEALLWQYIELSGGGHGRARRILRAIFADGSPRSLSEFREVFPNELKESPREDVNLKKREVDVNIDQDIYGDYLGQDDLDILEDGDDDDDDDDVASTGTGASGRPPKRARKRIQTPSSKGVTPKTSGGSLHSGYATDGEGSSTSLSTKLGGPSCVSLRLRLLKLLIHISSHQTLMATSPTTFPDLEDLYTNYVEFIRPLPVAAFAQIVLPHPSNPLELPSLTNVCERLLQQLLETSAPRYKSHVLLSGRKLEQEYLPFAASKNSVDANARISLLLESLTRCLVRAGELKKTKRLVQAARAGVERRISRVADSVEKKAGSKKRQGDEAVAWEWLVESGERIQKAIEGSAQ